MYMFKSQTIKVLKIRYKPSKGFFVLQNYGECPCLQIL